MSDMIIEMISEFICSGCSVGGGPSSCEKFELSQRGCANHSPGTFILGVPGKFALGLPRGFCKVGHVKNGTEGKALDTLFIHCYESMQDHDSEVGVYDDFNVPVWALEKDGYLFVRVYRPRINQTLVDVIKGADVSYLPKRTIDVGEFYDEID